jgi:outer membrane lipoprotein-sorting protein
MKTLIATLLFVATPVAALAAESDEAEKIAHALLAKNTGYKDLSVKIRMELKDAGGQAASREIRVRALEDGRTPYTMIIFDSPKDVKGTALLSHGEDQWLYLPSAGRERRIAASSRAGAFAGSEFAFEDLGAIDPAQVEWKILGHEACGSSQCVLLEGRPKTEGSGYSRRVLTIDRASYRLERVAFYDRKGELLKTLTYSEHEKLLGKFERPKVWTMINHQSGKSTVLRFDDFRFDSGLDAGDFSAARLGNVR